MNIILNGEARQTDAATLIDLLKECGFGSAIATARNGNFVPVAARADTLVCDGDEIEVVSPMQGG